MTSTDAGVRVIEQPRFLTLLGLRFWDPVLDAQVRGGLDVRAWAASDRAPRVEAFTTASDVYAFSHLPGMRAVEGGAPDEGSPPAARPFVVEVADRQRRYLPVAFTVDLPLPYPGLYLAGSPLAGLSGSGFNLLSAPSRRAPSWLAAIRGELADADADGQAAAHALVRVRTPDGRIWHGAADADGRYLVLFAYPSAPGIAEDSPPLATSPPRLGRRWEVRVEVFYSPSTRVALPGSALPSYASLLTQARASVFATRRQDGGVATPWIDAELEHGRELVVQTQASSKLLVSAAPTSP